jgi:hypothetical protein
MDISEFKKHPIYTNYASDKNGNVINLVIQKFLVAQCHKNNYKLIYIRIKPNAQKKYMLHRFIYECHNGLIPSDKEIDHIDNNRSNNKLENLQLLSHRENNNKSNISRNFKRNSNVCIKSTCIETGELDHFHSYSSVQRDLGIHSAIVYMICNVENGVKSGKSKIDGKYYRFEFIDKLPNDYNRPRRTIKKNNSS